MWHTWLFFFFFFLTTGILSRLELWNSSSCLRVISNGVSMLLTLVNRIDQPNFTHHKLRVKITLFYKLNFRQKKWKQIRDSLLPENRKKSGKTKCALKKTNKHKNENKTKQKRNKNETKRMKANLNKTKQTKNTEVVWNFYNLS